jgi:hypothetical protein
MRPSDDWNRTKQTPAFPTRGTPTGWRDWWDDPDDSAELRAHAEAAEHEIEARVATMAPAWQQEIVAERRTLARDLHSQERSR